MKCSAVYLPGCCFQSTDSIHINVALLHTVIYAVFITPETCTRACKDKVLRKPCSSLLPDKVSFLTEATH